MSDSTMIVNWNIFLIINQHFLFVGPTANCLTNLYHATVCDSRCKLDSACLGSTYELHLMYPLQHNT